jgi:carbamoyl-phosphate synthase large subunit
MTVRVAVTGVTGDVGLGAISGLRAEFGDAEDIWILGLDSMADCAARHFVDAYVQSPYVSDPQYSDRLVKILLAYDIEVLLPGIDSEIAILSRDRDQFSRAGIRLAIASSELVEAASDKLITASYLTARGIPAPLTRDADNAEAVDFPLIAKPRRGHGSQGIFFLKNGDDLDRFLGEGRESYCLQRYVEGPEITVGFLYDVDGVLRDAIAMERTLVGGRTAYGKVVTRPEIERFMEEFGSRIRGVGAINAQIRLDASAGPMVFEVNARLSGSTGMRVAVGFNDPARLALHFARGIPIRRAAVRTATVYRYLTELVVAN